MAPDKVTVKGQGIRFLERGRQTLKAAQDFFRRRKEVEISARRQGKSRLDAVKPRVDQKGKGQVGVHPGIGRAQLGSFPETRRRGDADELGAVFA